jgi:hypothetical protein
VEERDKALAKAAKDSASATSAAKELAAVRKELDALRGKEGEVMVRCHFRDVDS